MQSIISSPTPSISTFALVSFSNWFASFINGHINVGVFVNFSFCSSRNKFITQQEKFSKENMSDSCSVNIFFIVNADW
jgi:hypothetical protein